jgi:hypothetical protein
MRLKAGVRLGLLQPQIVLALQVAEKIFDRYYVDLVITSCNDGRHMEGSKHYTGCAVDLRTKHIDGEHTLAVFGVSGGEVKQKILRQLKRALGMDFDILLEGLGTAHEHIHLEWDPK